MWKLDNPYHRHGHALPLSHSQSSGLNGYRSHTVVWGTNPLAVFRVTHTVLPRRPIKPVIAIKLLKVLGASQSRTSTAQQSQRLLGLRIQWQATTTEYVHDLIYATLFRAGRPISVPLISMIWFLDPASLIRVELHYRESQSYWSLLLKHIWPGTR